MNKKLFLLPLLAFLMVGCTKPTGGNSGGQGGGQQEGGGGQGEGGGGQGEGGGGGGQTGGQGTEASPYSFDELMSVAEKITSGNQGTGAIYATGKVVAGVDTYSEATPKVRSGRTSFHIGTSSKNILIYNANDADNQASFQTVPVAVGDTVLFTGVIKNYNGTLEVCYVKDVGDCKLLTVNGKKATGTTGGGQGEGGGGGTEDGGGGGSSIPTDAKTISYDFTAAKAACPEYDAGLKDVAKDITVSGKAFKEVNCYNSSNTSNFMLGAKKYSSNAYVASQEAVGGSIVGMKIVVPVGASGNTRFHIGFGTSAMNAAYTAGDDVIPAKGSTGELTSEVTLELTADQASAYTYFNITAVYSSSAKYNGCIGTVTVYYK